MPTRQLTFEIEPHPDVRARQAAGEPAWLTGAVKANVELPVNVDLNSGDKLLVSIADEDGQVLSRGYLEVGTVALVPIREKDLGVIGHERLHKAKLTEVDPAATAGG